jgi:hypothetical protein
MKHLFTELYETANTYLCASVFALAVYGSSASAQQPAATVATDTAQLVVLNVPLENEIVLSNHGSVGSVIKIVDVTINGRAKFSRITHFEGRVIALFHGLPAGISGAL